MHQAGSGPHGLPPCPAGAAWLPEAQAARHGPCIGKSLPEAGHSPQCRQPGRKGCLTPSGSPKQAARSTREPRRAVPGGKETPAPSCRRKPGAQSCNTTQLRLPQAAPAVNAIRPQTLDGCIRKSNAPAPSPQPSLARSREKVQPQGPPALSPPQAGVLTLGQGLQGHGALSRREAHQPLALQV